MRPFLLFPLPGPAAPGGRPPSPAGRGPDLTGRAERSVRRPGPTDGPPPGTQTAPGRPPATPAEGPGTADDPLLTIDEVIAELRVSRAAFYRWRRQEPARQSCGCRAAACGSGAARSPRGCAAWKTDTQDGQEQGADGQLRRQVLGHQEARQRRPARFRVRWAVDGREHCKSFKARPLADGFLDGLKDAVRDRRPFNPRTGLPDAETTEEEMITWYEHARAYAEAKWPNLAPVSRRSVAEALVTVTIALTAKEPGAPEPKVLRQALFAWAFNPATRDTDPPPEIAAALDWAERASLPVAELEDTATVRLALAACARTLTGKAAAGSTQRRKRSVFYNALGYAVEQGHLAANPVDRIQWTTPAVAAERRPAGRGQPRPGQEPAGRRPGTERPGAAPGSVLRLPVLRRAAPLGGRHAPRGRPAPADEGLGQDRPGRLRLPRRARPGPTTAPPARNAA